ncbi:hypothetical protein [Pseudooceanicola sp. 200-1SW]|uniref:hypothetical protein n=1 Tax=Pseudooceanicola sp. 200-1SW TaxID=3425949 RepID=UPI003D7FC245
MMPDTGSQDDDDMGRGPDATSGAGAPLGPEGSESATNPLHAGRAQLFDLLREQGAPPASRPADAPEVTAVSDFLRAQMARPTDRGDKSRRLLRWLLRG